MDKKRMLGVLPNTPAGQQAAWVWQRLLAVGAGAAVPDGSELEEHYAPAWLSEVPLAALFSQLAPVMASVTGVRQEPARPNEVRVVLDLADGSIMRFRCAVQETLPHRIVFQLLSPAIAESGYVDREIQRDGRSVRVRDFGGDGRLLLLWHGAGCDATIWDAMVPYLPCFRVVAQDLPGHGDSPLARLSVGDTVDDALAVLADLDMGEPVVVGHSMGGWAALHYAATEPCAAVVCLDGPTRLDYAGMGLQTDHPAFIPDPPDVAVDLGALCCPAMVVFCSGASPDEAKWMVPFRLRLSEYLAREHPEIRVEWRPSGHMVLLMQPRQTAELISQFALGETP